MALPHRTTAEQDTWLSSRSLHSVTFAASGMHDGYQLLELTAATFAASPDMLAASTHTLEVGPPPLLMPLPYTNA